MSKAPPVGFRGATWQGKPPEQAQLPALNWAEKGFGLRSLPSCERPAHRTDGQTELTSISSRNAKMGH